MTFLSVRGAEEFARAKYQPTRFHVDTLRATYLHENIGRSGTEDEGRVWRMLPAQQQGQKSSPTRAQQKDVELRGTPKVFRFILA